MLQENNNYIEKNQNATSQEIVSIPVPLFESIQGKYFVGQTETLIVGNGLSAWAGLVNPSNSGVNLYTNVFTISNFSDDYLIAEIWLNTTLPESGKLSHKISPTNTSLKLLPQNKVNIRFVKSTNVFPRNGSNVYERIVPPNTTLVAEEDGKFIEPPNGNYIIVIHPSKNYSQLSKVIAAFGWWEKPRY